MISECADFGRAQGALGEEETLLSCSYYDAGRAKVRSDGAFSVRFVK